MKITHYDLFAGIGGFSLALDTVFYESEIKHIFCEWEAFPTAVLKKHWPDGTYYGDIADLVAHTSNLNDRGNARELSQEDEQQASERQEKRSTKPSGTNLTLLTGGFPCQPFSHAGRRQGTADDRYRWPDMFAVIKNVRPDWVIAENVRGLVTWNDGMVLETVCADLESEGYEVQPIVIPAVAVGAPHRRDRVWIIAHAIDNRQGREERGVDETQDSVPQEHRTEDSTTRESERTTSDRMLNGYAPNPQSTGTRENIGGLWGLSERHNQREQGEEHTTITPNPKRHGEYGARRVQGHRKTESESDETSNTPITKDAAKWSRDWREVAFATCHDGVDDGLPRRMDGATISVSRHRKERLKACGNAIVPQVAMEIFTAIRSVYRELET